MACGLLRANLQQEYTVRRLVSMYRVVEEELQLLLAGRYVYLDIL